MDLQFVTKGFDRKKKWFLALALFGVSTYGAYKVYHFPSVAKRRKRLTKLFGAILSMAELASDSAEALGVVSRDLKEFLISDSDQIPSSLRQLSKIARSEEFSESVIKITRAMTIGLLRGYCIETNGRLNEDGDGKGVKLGFSDRVLDKMMSTAGTGFVSSIVGSFARNLVVGVLSKEQFSEALNGKRLASTSNAESGSSSLPEWVSVVCSSDCKLLIADCVRAFVGTAVTVYLDKTMDMNFYDDLFSGLTNPKHETNVRDFLISVCNGAVETFVKTSHQVLTNTKTDSDPRSCSSHIIIRHTDGPNRTGDEYLNQVSPSKRVKQKGKCNEIENSGWVSTVSSTLAIPNNRRFVLDVTGRVTYETTRSLIEFFFWRFSECLKRTLSVVNEEVVGRGSEVIRYIDARSSVIVTIFLALYLHILGGSRALLPA